jgi:septum site-determining protein MinC
MAATKSKIKIKQNKKGSYLDLSQENLLADSFADDFKGYLSEIKDFLSGNSVSLIVPTEISLEESLSTELGEVVKNIQTELNKYNIALKSLCKVDSEENIDARYIDPETVEQKQRKQAEIVSNLPETLFIKHNLRSGQLVRYPGTVVVFGDVNPQAELIASGDIIVWGTLRGLAHAGSQGDEAAIIAAHRLDCGQLRIADKMIAISSKMHKQQRFLKDRKSVTPEIARIVDNEIKILKN